MKILITDTYRIARHPFQMRKKLYDIFAEDKVDKFLSDPQIT